MSQSIKHLYEFGPFRLDAGERLLLRDGESVPLTPKAFDLLLALVERHGRLVEKEELFKAVWPDTIVEESNLTYNIALIRKALGDGTNGERYIETVPKRGYRFVAEVREARPAGDEPLHEQAAPNARTSSPVMLTAPEASAPRTKRSGWRDRLWMLATGGLGLALFALGVAYVRRPALEAELRRFLVNPPEKAKLFDWPAISPDGRTLAFTAEVDGKTQLWVRALGTTTARPLVEVRDSNPVPFWSPDSQFIAYFEQRKLKKIALAGGTPETLCDTLVGNGGTWNREGVILFGDGPSGIRRTSANGELAPPSPALTLRAGTEVTRLQSFCPMDVTSFFT